MLIILIYCAGWAADSGNFKDTDSEYLANEDYNTVNTSNKDNNTVKQRG